MHGQIYAVVQQSLLYFLGENVLRADRLDARLLLAVAVVMMGTSSTVWPNSRSRAATHWACHWAKALARVPRSSGIVLFGCQV